MKRVTILSRGVADELVRAGVELLSARSGDNWWQSIDVAKLDLGTYCHCIEAQLLGAREEQQWNRLNHLLDIDPADYGFNLPSEYHKRDPKAHNPNWAVLTEAWRRAIERLKAERRRAIERLKAEQAAA